MRSASKLYSSSKYLKFISLVLEAAAASDCKGASFCFEYPFFSLLLNTEPMTFGRSSTFLGAGLLDCGLLEATTLEPLSLLLAS